jgi:acyl-CoA thioesterase
VDLHARSLSRPNAVDTPVAARKPASVGTSFAAEIVVEPLGGGRYRAALSDRWNLRPLPQGGVITALALRAMAAELGDPTQLLRTMHTTFVGQVAHGPLEIEVELLRRGRSMSHLRAEVRNVGAARGHVTIAAFGASREGFDFTDLVPPDVPPPEASRSFRDPPPPGVDPMPPMPFWDELVEGRQAFGHTPGEPWEPQPAERAVWYRFDDPPIGDDAHLDPLALAVLGDVMPGAVWERVGDGARPWFAPSVDLTLHVFAPAPPGWILGHNRVRHAGDGYASADMALWDLTATPRLVAYATQVFLFSFLD